MGTALSNVKLFGWLKDIYHWCMRWADHPYGVHALCVLAAVESVFFPIPVDPILIAMGAARPSRALVFALLTTAFSVAGAGLGYLVGYLFWDLSQEFFFSYVFSPEVFQQVTAHFQSNAFLSIFLAGFTPIPFKVFTIAAGVAHLDLFGFFAGAVCGRGLRFLTEGAVLYFFGPQMRVYLEKHFERVTIVLGLLVITFFVAYRLWSTM